MAGKRTALPHIEALDGLRGLAVLAILLFHAGHLTGGWLGVDVFFVLSGFLITSLLLAEREATGRISLVSFWGRRARRLIPALLLTLLGVGLYAAVFAAPGELARIRADAIATLFYVQNWHAILAGHDYWEIFRRPSPLDHTWSLAIEEQFYLLWPPVVLFVMRERAANRALAWTAGLLALLSSVWMAACYDPDEGSARVYFGTDTRIAATLVGAMVAAALRSQVRAWPGSPSRGADAAALLGLLAVASASLFLDGADPGVYRGGLAALLLASALVVVGVVLAPKGVAARILGLRPLCWLGVISYGVYLWHWPINLVLTPERVGWSGWPLTTLRIALTLGVASASYLTLERPIRRGERLTQRPLPIALLASAAVIGCVWLATTAPAASHAPEASIPQRPADSPAGTPQVDLLLIGDSVAFQLQDELLKEARSRGLRAEAMASEGCVSLRSRAIRFLSGQVFDLRPCLKLREHWVAWVARRAPDTVLLLEGWSGEGEKQIAGRWAHPCEADFDAAQASDLAELIQSFTAAGATTVLAAMPLPSVSDLSPNYSRHWGGIGDDALRTLFRERMACLNRVRKEVASSTEAILVDLEGEVCNAGSCRRRQDGFTLRPDGMHFQGPGAAWASRWLLDQIDTRK